MGAYPGFEVTEILTPKNPNVAVEISLKRGGKKRQLLFDPYSGKDLGNAEPREMPLVTWLVDLHDNLLGGQRGRTVNGAGSILLTLLCLTGAVIWWPGTGSWRRSVMVRWNVSRSISGSRRLLRAG